MESHNPKHIVFLFVLFAFISCKKDKPEPEAEPPLSWSVIEGNYKVYDTLGSYLYDMNIVHIPFPNMQYTDSLRFENFDGNYTITAMQNYYTNIAGYDVNIGVHNPVYDSLGNRTKIFSTNWEGYNYFENDTILLRFQKNNIQYYIQDLTPYYECDCIQVAVKQN